MIPVAVSETKSRQVPRAPKELLASPAFLLARLGLLIKGRAMDEFERTGGDGYHYGVLALKEDHHPVVGDHRINLTFRKAG